MQQFNILSSLALHQCHLLSIHLFIPAALSPSLLQLPTSLDLPIPTRRTNRSKSDCSHGLSCPVRVNRTRPTPNVLCAFAAPMQERPWSNKTCKSNSTFPTKSSLLTAQVHFQVQKESSINLASLPLSDRLL